MNRKIILNVLIFTALLVNLLPAYSAVSVNQSPETGSSVNLLYSGQAGVAFELHSPEYSIEEVNHGDGLYQALRVEGLGLIEDSGYPQLPMTSVLLGIPPQGQVSIKIVDSQASDLTGINNLSPAPSTLAWDGDPNNLELSYVPNHEVYSSTSFFPASPAKIEEYGWIRDQRYVRIGLFPFQYNPATGVVLWHRILRLEVQFDGEANTQIKQNRYINIIDEDSQFEKILEGNILNYEQARDWRTPPPVEAEHQTSVSGERLRIGVDRDGLYRINYTDLVNAGMAGIDPRTYQMTNQGANVAITVVGEEDGTLDDGDYVLFYGEAFRGDRMAEWYADENHNWITYTRQISDGTTIPWHPVFNASMMEKYTSENVYWLQSVTGVTPTRMQTVDGTPEEADSPAYYKTTAHAEVQYGRWEYHFTGEDTWFWASVTATTTPTLTTSLSALYTEPYTAVVRSEYVAFTYDPLVTPDHHTVVRLNDQIDPINESYWDGRSRHSFEAGVPSSTLVEGINTLHFKVIEDDPIPVYSLIYFDWFEIDYLRRFVADNDVLDFPGELAGTWRYQLEGFTQANLDVYDITDPQLPKRITNAQTYWDGSYRVAFQVTHESGARFFAGGANMVLAPKSITRYIPPDLKSASNGADMLIIAHADFLGSAEILEDYRTSQGMRVRSVDIQDLYNEFNEGIRHPIAIKNFLEYTFANWTPPAPQYVLLVGDGHWDLLGTGYPYTTMPVYMPPNLSWVDPLQGEVDSSNLLATIAGDDPLPDVFIGRIPVNTAQEFLNVINKIIAFEQAPNQAWQLNNTFIADNTPDEDGNFSAMANYIIDAYIEPGFVPIRIYEDDFACTTYPCPAVTEAILDNFNVTGTLFATYIGHGSVQWWSHERIFANSNIASMVNSNKLPIILSMDCLDGYWIHPITQPSMAELFLRTANNGAVATFSPTGLGVGLGHYALMQGFFDTVYKDGLWEMGAATLGAKIELYSAGYFRDMLHTYTTFGDPATKLPNPYSITVSPTAAEKQGSQGSQVQYSIQIVNNGTLSDTVYLSVEENSWITTLSADLLYLEPGQSTEISVTVDIPEEIMPGDSDDAIIRARSDGDFAEQKTVTINTTAMIRVRLPMIRK